MTRQIQHFIDGRRTPLSSTRTADVFNPSTGAVQAQVLLASAADVDTAVASAVEAQKEWAAWNPQKRARVMMKFIELVNANMGELAELLSIEHGKTVTDAEGDIQRGIEVIEFAIGIPHLMKGEFTEGAGPGIDVYSIRQPLGVVCGITPFNFPAMIPLWKAGPALGVRQRLRSQALRARSLGAAATGRVVHRSRPAAGCLPGRQWRQGGSRRPAGPPRHQGLRIRRQFRYRAVHLLRRRGER